MEYETKETLKKDMIIVLNFAKNWCFMIEEMFNIKEV